MERILFTADPRAQGLNQADINRQLKAGLLERIRRGSFASPLEDPSLESQHRRTVLATVPHLEAGQSRLGRRPARVADLARHGQPRSPHPIA